MPVLSLDSLKSRKPKTKDIPLQDGEMVRIRVIGGADRDLFFDKVRRQKDEGIAYDTGTLKGLIVAMSLANEDGSFMFPRGEQFEASVSEVSQWDVETIDAIYEPALRHSRLTNDSTEESAKN